MAFGDGGAGGDAVVVVVSGFGVDFIELFRGGGGVLLRTGFGPSICVNLP